MIQINSVSKKFGEQSVVRDISLKIASGETHVLLGVSGSGKSTLLRLITGVVGPDKGTVELDSVVVTTKNIRLNAQKTGYVIQEGGLFPHLTAYENILLKALVLEDHSKVDYTNRIEELTQKVRLDFSLLQKYPSKLSGGERQRVGLIRALLINPKVLLFDEPLGALDPITRHELQIELRSLFKELKKTVVFVTHDLSEAIFFADRISILHEGQINQTGTFAELIDKPASEFVTKFLNSQIPPKELRDFHQ